jgi:hypothetical protein
MKRPPEGFISDHAAFAERMEWAELSMDEEDFAHVELVYSQMQEFLDRWQGKVGVAELEEILARLRPAVDKIGQALEVKYLEALRDLLEQRHTVLIAPSIFEAGVAMLGFMKHAPESLRPGLETIFRDSMGYDFDAERYYRENENDMEDYTAEYNQAFAKMELAWPDHFTDETRARLAQAPIEEINAWKAQVNSRLNTAP